MTRSSFPRVDLAVGASQLVRRSLRWATRQLAPEVTLRDIAGAMGVSPFQLQRAFRQTVGEGAMTAVRRDHLRRAALRLAFRPGQSITTIALESGFASLEGFTRAFRRVVGMTPSAFRAGPDWDAWRRTFVAPGGDEREARPSADLLVAWQRMVAVVSQPPLRVLGLVYAPGGTFPSIHDALQSFIGWRRQRGNLHPRTHATWNAVYAPNSRHGHPTMILAVATTERLTATDRTAGVSLHELPGGRYARIRIEGPDTLTGPALVFLRDIWCPARRETVRDGPVLIRRLRVFPDVPDHEVCSDLYLPLCE